jgi:hypothetical protein
MKPTGLELVVEVDDKVVLVAYFKCTANLAV